MTSWECWGNDRRVVVLWSIGNRGEIREWGTEFFKLILRMWGTRGIRGENITGVADKQVLV